MLYTMMDSRVLIHQILHINVHDDVTVACFALTTTI